MARSLEMGSAGWELDDGTDMIHVRQLMNGCIAGKVRSLRSFPESADLSAGRSKNKERLPIRALTLYRRPSALKHT